MKKIILISSLFAATLGIANAQNTAAAAQPQTAAPKAAVKEEKQQTPQDMAKEKVSEMNTICKLSGDQTGKITKLYVDFFTGREALKAKKTSLSNDEFKTKMGDLKSHRNEALKAVLTTGQQKLLKEAKKEMDKENPGVAKPKETKN